MPLLWIKPVPLQGVLDVTAFKNYNGDESTNMSIMMALESGYISSDCKGYGLLW